MLGSEGHLTVGRERGKLEVLLAVEVSFAVGLPRGVDSCEETSLVEEIKVFSLSNCIFYLSTAREKSCIPVVHNC